MDNAAFPRELLERVVEAHEKLSEARREAFRREAIRAALSADLRELERLLMYAEALEQSA